MPLSPSVLIGVVLVSVFLNRLRDGANVAATILTLSELVFNHLLRAFSVKG